MLQLMDKKKFIILYFHFFYLTGPMDSQPNKLKLHVHHFFNFFTSFENSVDSDQ